MRVLRDDVVACKSYIPAAGDDNSLLLSSPCRSMAVSTACLLQLLSQNKSGPILWSLDNVVERDNSSNSIVSTTAKKCVIFPYSYSTTFFVPVTPCVLQKVLKQELSQGIRSRALGTEILSKIFRKTRFKIPALMRPRFGKNMGCAL
jgi:hypothetical protein